MVIIVQVLLALTFIFFCVLTYYFTKTWRALHVVTVFLTFVMGIVLALMTSMTLKTHSAWRSKYEDYKAQLTQAQSDGEMLEFGDRTRVEQVQPTVLSLSSRFNRLMYERGRVWRGAVKVQADATAAQLRVVPENAPQGTQHGINRNMIVYAFHEQSPGVDANNQPLKPVPSTFMGEFKVTGVTEAAVTIAPNLPLDAVQRSLMNSDSTWVLYETMPLDGHYIFNDSNSPGSALSGDEFIDLTNEPDQSVFGAMSQEEIDKLFAWGINWNIPGNDMNDPRRQRYITGNFPGSFGPLLGPESAHSRDGSPLRGGDETRVPEGNVWYKAEFTQAAANNPLLKVDVDADNPLLPGTSGFFDERGLSVAARLMRTEDEGGKQAVLKPNMIGLFKRGSEDINDGGDEIHAEDLDDWVDAGLCTVSPIYVRNLRNYQEEFHQVFVRRQKAEDDIGTATRHIATLNETKSAIDEQNLYRQDEVRKLSGMGLPEGQLGDLPGYQAEQAAMDKLLADLDGELQTTREHLSSLYRTNAALEAKLADVQQRLKAEIDRRTAEAAKASDAGE